MEITQLKEFLIIARVGTFSKAAQELYISQATLSKHIMALEKSVGNTLFDRTTRSIKLTATGNMLIPYAEKIVAHNDEFFSKLTPENDADTHKIVIFSIPVIAHYDISQSIAQFCRLHPDYSIKICEYEANEIPELLAVQQCDLAFHRFIDEDKAMESTIYYVDDLVAILPLDHPAAGQKSIHLSQLSEESFMFLDEKTMILPLCMKACQEAGFVPTINYLGHRSENIIEMVSNGMGISLMMKKQAEFSKNQFISMVKLDPPIHSTIYLVRLRNVKHKVAAQAFWNFVRNNQPVHNEI